MREIIKDILNRLGWVESNVRKLKESGSELSTVATTGSYTDLTDKPTIPTIPTKITASEANTGTATTQRTLDAVTLKTAIQTHAAPSLISLPGYSATDTQTLKNISGVLTWVTDVTV